MMNYAILMSVLMLASTAIAAPCPTYTPQSSPYFCDFWTDGDPFFTGQYPVYAVSDSGATCGVSTVTETGQFLIHVIGDSGDVNMPWYGSLVQFRNEQIGGCADIHWKVIDGPYDDEIGNWVVGWHNQTSNEIALIWPGDFDENGAVDIIDLMRLVRVAFYGETDNTVYDLSGDCVIDIVDVALLNQIVNQGGAYHGQMGYGCQ